MRTPPEAIDLIMRAEGLRLTAYPDQGGVLTIGFGSTTNVTAGMVITEEEAEDRLWQDIAQFEARIEQAVHAPLTDNQVGALVSLVYNIGFENFKNSTMLKFLNSLCFFDAAGEFDKWCHVNKKFCDGLLKRRQAEQKLFSTPDGERVPPFYP